MSPYIENDEGRIVLVVGDCDESVVMSTGTVAASARSGDKMTPSTTRSATTTALIARTRSDPRGPRTDCDYPGLLSLE
jgi:hypothetical protein